MSNVESMKKDPRLRSGDRLLLFVSIPLLCISLCLPLWIRSQYHEGVLAIIEQDLKCIDIFRLDTICESFECTYHRENNEEQINVVRIEPGRIRVIEATCSEQIDVHTGWLSFPGQTAVCLPHRFVIRLEPYSSDVSDIDVILK